MSLLSAAFAACKTIRARWASPCAVLRRDARFSSSRRSFGVKSIATAVLPTAKILRANVRRDKILRANVRRDKILRANVRRESHIFVDQDTSSFCEVAPNRSERRLGVGRVII